MAITDGNYDNIYVSFADNFYLADALPAHILTWLDIILANTGIASY